MNTHLLIIDMQNDFCTQDDGKGHQGQLYVAGGEQDCLNVASMVLRHKSRINEIHATMDSHHMFHVAHPHPKMWRNAETGQTPAPFTLVTGYNASLGVFEAIELLNNSKPVTLRTGEPALTERTKKYVESLSARGRNSLVIWPMHCLIGSWGHNIEPHLFDALRNWEYENGFVNYVTKGSNIYTEHYSAVEADVPDPKDATTSLNTQLIETIQEADRILIAGEASSHCVKFTITDIANNFGEENIKKFIFLEDCSSPVTGFESAATDFINEMTARGMQMARSTDVF